MSVYPNLLEQLNRKNFFEGGDIASSEEACLDVLFDLGQKARMRSRTSSKNRRSLLRVWDFSQGNRYLEGRICRVSRIP
jgi:hypothetical protein